MSDPYGDDANRQMILPPQPRSRSLADYIRENKVMVAIVILILAALFWWFFLRKPSTNVTTNISTSPTSIPNGNPGKLQISKRVY